MEEPKTPQALIASIQAYCEGRRVIFRGTSRQYPEVSSGLYRKYRKEDPPIFNEHFQPVDIEKEIVENVRGYFSTAASNVECLTDLRHFGADTTLIDFSRSLFVALFFACDGDPEEDGHLIAFDADTVNNVKDIDYGGAGKGEITILEPARTAQSRARIEFQCSVFVHVPGGVIPSERCEFFCVPKDMKEECRKYLRDFCQIRDATIYNDLMGFIDNEENFKTASVEFYRGVAAENPEEAVKYYNEAIDLRPDKVETYNNRGNARRNLGDHEGAIADYDRVVELRPDFAKAYNNRGGHEG